MATRYERIADDLRHQIQSGDLAPGTRLPSETQLAAHYQVGKPTLRHALALLQNQGLLEKRHGIGNFIRHPHPPITYTPHTPPHNDPPTRTRVTRRDLPADAALSALLHLPPGTPVVELTYLTRQNDTPHSLARTYLPHSIAGTLTPDTAIPPTPWADDIPHRLTTAGIPLTHTTERLTARPATPHEAELLTLPTHTHVLTIQRTTHTTDGPPPTTTTLTLPADRTTALYTTTPTP